MSLNIINETDIKTLSKTLIDIIKEEEKVSLKDMKKFYLMVQLQLYSQVLLQ